MSDHAKEAADLRAEAAAIKVTDHFSRQRRQQLLDQAYKREQSAKVAEQVAAPPPAPMPESEPAACSEPMVQAAELRRKAEELKGTEPGVSIHKRQLLTRAEGLERSARIASFGAQPAPAQSTPAASSASAPPPAPPAPASSLPLPPPPPPPTLPAVPPIVPNPEEQAFRAGELAKAPQLSQRAYDIRPSPTLFYNQAIICEKMGHVALAVQHYRRYLASDEINPPIRKRCEERIAALLLEGEEAQEPERPGGTAQAVDPDPRAAAAGAAQDRAMKLATDKLALLDEALRAGKGIREAARHAGVHPDTATARRRDLGLPPKDHAYRPGTVVAQEGGHRDGLEAPQGVQGTPPSGGPLPCAPPLVPEQPPAQHWEVYVGPPREQAAQTELLRVRTLLLAARPLLDSALRTNRRGGVADELLSLALGVLDQAMPAKEAP